MQTTFKEKSSSHLPKFRKYVIGSSSSKETSRDGLSQDLAQPEAQPDGFRGIWIAPFLTFEGPKVNSRWTHPKPLFKDLII